MEAYAGAVQTGHGGRDGGLRGQLSDEDSTATGRRRKAGAAGDSTPARARAVRSGDPEDRTWCTPNLRQSGMTWNELGYAGRGGHLPGNTQKRRASPS